MSKEPGSEHQTYCYSVIYLNHMSYAAGGSTGRQVHIQAELRTHGSSGPCWWINHISAILHHIVSYNILTCFHQILMGHCLSVCERVCFYVTSFPQTAAYRMFVCMWERERERQPAGSLTVIFTDWRRQHHHHTLSVCVCVRLRDKHKERGICMKAAVAFLSSDFILSPPVTPQWTEN